MDLTFRENYDKNINKFFLFLILLHIPLFLGVASYFKTEYSIAFLSPIVVLIGPLLGYIKSPQSKFNMILNSFAMMCMSATIIHLGKGLIEMHFHIFIALTVLIIFGRILPILVGLVTIAVHHISFFFLLPKSLFNYEASFSTVLLHAAFAVISAIVAGFLARKFGLFIDAQEEIVTNLKKAVNSNKNLSEKINDISAMVSETTNNQASAVQQSVSTLEEITKMVDMTTKNIQDTKQNTDHSFKIAEDGKSSVSSVTSSIGDIRSSNDTMVSELNHNMAQIQEITELINQIADKTKIINDIVFQTKLLSFNASVEAARAGEHGKGFAVVAEEVGNLANMSGSASEEINTLLESSISRVNKIVSESQRNMEKISKDGQIVLHKGVEKSNESLQILQDVVQNIRKNNDLMQNITTAAEEQSRGIQEITQAIRAIDGSNHENIGLVNQLQSLAESMGKESETLGDVVVSIEKKLAS